MDVFQLFYCNSTGMYSYSFNFPVADPEMIIRRGPLPV